jgi:hypothetical protein
MRKARDARKRGRWGRQGWKEKAGREKAGRRTQVRAFHVTL